MADWRALNVVVEAGEEPLHLTLGDLIDANADAMDATDGEEIAGMIRTGATYHGGGGAAAAWSVTAA